MENKEIVYKEISQLKQSGWKWREVSEAVGLTTRQAESVWGYFKRLEEKRNLAATGTPCLRCKKPFRQDSKFHRFCSRCKGRPGNDWLAAS